MHNHHANHHVSHDVSHDTSHVFSTWTSPLKQCFGMHALYHGSHTRSLTVDPS
jgi:hypothetical protein